MGEFLQNNAQLSPLGRATTWVSYYPTLVTT